MRCEKGATPEIKPAPIATRAQWIKDGPSWAIAVLGILTEERQLRSEERRCMQDLRKQGIIR